MALVSSSIPNLINGISQQPPEIRLSSQCERQVNGLSSIARGLEKRPGTEHKNKITSTLVDDTFVHSIRRDRTEEYTMVLTRASGTDSSVRTKTLTIYDQDGVSVPVKSNTNNAVASATTITSADLVYLDTLINVGGVQDSIVATTVADTTFLINKTKVVTKATTDGAVSGEGSVDWKTSSKGSEQLEVRLLSCVLTYGSTTVTVQAGDTSKLATGMTISGTGVPVPGSTTISSIDAGANTFAMSASANEAATTSLEFSRGYTDEGLIYVKTGDYSSKYVIKLVINPAGVAGTAIASKRTYRIGYQTPSSTVNLNQKHIGTPNIAAVLKAGNTDESTAAGAWDDFDSTDPIEGFGGWRCVLNRDESGETDALYEPGFDAIAVIENGLATANFVVSMDDTSGSVLSLKCKQPFTIEVQDSKGGASLVGIKNETLSFTSLPGKNVPIGYIVKVVGNASATQDDFYVKYEQEVGGEGVWKETIAPSLDTGFDVTTMPHRLIRLYDNATPPQKFFLYEPVKEVAAGTGATSSFGARFGWSSRKAGDDLSNPFATFTGGKINDILFHKNRFGILSDENIIFSEAGNYYNFFPISVMTALDGNPIDISVSNNQVSILTHAAAFDQSVLLFSDFQQFSLNSEGEGFTPSTVSVDVVTQFESTSKAPPVSSGKFVYFPFDRGEYSGVREYFVDIGSSDSNDATDITAHVPQYIKGNITKMMVSSNEQMVAVLSDDDKKRIYIYKNFWQGQEKLQNSWSHWTFDGDILNCAFLGSTLKLLVKRTDGLYLEDINLSLDSAEAVMEDETAVLLDRRVKLTYNASFTLSASNLPYFANKPTNMVYVTDQARKIAEADINTYLRVAENTTGVPSVVYAGIPYTFEYEFSRFIHKMNELPVQTAKLQIRNINLLYNKTGYFNLKINVDPGTIKISDGNNGTTEITPRTNYEKKFSGMLTNTSSFGEYKLLSGTFKGGVMSKASNCNIIIENDEYLPCSFQSAEWEGFLHIRSQRV